MVCYNSFDRIFGAHVREGKISEEYGGVEL